MNSLSTFEKLTVYLAYGSADPPSLNHAAIPSSNAYKILLLLCYSVSYTATYAESVPVLHTERGRGAFSLVSFPHCVINRILISLPCRCAIRHTHKVPFFGRRATSCNCQPPQSRASCTNPISCRLGTSTMPFQRDSMDSVGRPSLDRITGASGASSILSRTSSLMDSQYLDAGCASAPGTRYGTLNQVMEGRRDMLVCMHACSRGMCRETNNACRVSAIISRHSSLQMCTGLLRGSGDVYSRRDTTRRQADICCGRLRW